MPTTDFSTHPHLILSQTRREEQGFSLLQEDRSGISFKLLMHDLVIESGILTSTNNQTPMCEKNCGDNMMKEGAFAIKWLVQQQNEVKCHLPVFSLGGSERSTQKHTPIKMQCGFVSLKGSLHCGFNLTSKRQSTLIIVLEAKKTLSQPFSGNQSLTEISKFVKTTVVTSQAASFVCFKLSKS